MENQLYIELGTTLQIEINKYRRITTELIGVDEGQYLIIRLPDDFHMGNQTRLYPKGTPIIVRYIFKGLVFGFQSAIVHYIHSPAKLIFIMYPEQVEDYNLRSSKRVTCYLPATIHADDNAAQGFITNISQSGSRFAVNTQDMKDVHDFQKFDGIVQMAIPLPGIAGALDIEGEIKNVSMDKEILIFGIKYTKISKEDSRRLGKFLDEADQFSALE